MALKVDNLSLLELEGSEEDKQSESADAIRSVVYGREGRKEGKKGSSAGSKAVRTNLYHVRGSLFLLHTDSSSSSAEVRAVELFMKNNQIKI